MCEQMDKTTETYKRMTEAIKGWANENFAGWTEFSVTGRGEDGKLVFFALVRPKEISPAS